MKEAGVYRLRSASRAFVIAVLVLLAILRAGPAAAQVSGARPGADTVHVAAPTGETETDRASILAALEEVPPGGTLQFAAGTYITGGLNLDIGVPGIILVGHPEGTTIRGCEPKVFEDWEVARFACNALGLSGGHQTVRGFNFEYAWHGLTVGCCLPTDAEQVRSMEWEAEPTRPGGDLIEGNTFRYTPNGLRVMGRSTEPTVVRENRFIDVYHAIGINGGGVHFLDNRIYTDQPHRVPTSTHPGDAINVSPARGPGDHTSCSDNVVAGNHIEGHTHGIRIGVYAPDTSCRRNIIRGNTILVVRVPFARTWWGIQSSDDADSTVVGVPLSLFNYPMVEPGTHGRGEPGRLPVIEDNLIEGNEILGGHGLGIEVVHASGNRIVDNSIRGIRARDPFPGNVLMSELVPWQEANGSGVWLSAGSTGNEIAGNMFDDIAGHAVVIEGDSNRVELRSTSDSVRDLGSGNRVTVAERGPAVRADVVARLDSLARAALDSGPVAGFSVAVLQGDDTLLLAGYGHADIGLGVGATEDTRYRLVGPSATILAALVMRQVEEGRESIRSHGEPRPRSGWCSLSKMDRRSRSRSEALRVARGSAETGRSRSAAEMIAILQRAPSGLAQSRSFAVLQGDAR